jgi:hypothetical protein
LEKVACGAFSDGGFVAGRKKRGFCDLLIRVATPGRAFSDGGFVAAAKSVVFAACAFA